MCGVVVDILGLIVQNTTPLSMFLCCLLFLRHPQRLGIHQDEQELMPGDHSWKYYCKEFWQLHTFCHYNNDHQPDEKKTNVMKNRAYI